MKQTLIKVLATSALASAVFTGCMGPAKPDFGCKKEGEPAPEWTCKPYKEGAMVALGTAPQNAGNDFSMQMAEAMAEGRDSLANQMSVKVSTLFKSFKATTGSGADATFDKSTSKVSKQLANQQMQGSRQLESWTSTKGTLYVLVGIANEPVKNAMEEAVKTSYKNDKAMYQEFKAFKAQGELDKELEKAAQ